MHNAGEVRSVRLVRALALVAVAASALACNRPVAERPTGNGPPGPFGNPRCDCPQDAAIPEPRATANGMCLPEAEDAGCQTLMPGGGALPPPELSALA
ncbi:MAG: hypothetical protein U0269_22925 [Polyangiales bacterium]